MRAMGPLRVAALQRRPYFDNVPETLQRLCQDLAWCVERGVQLALLPECYLQGYAPDRQSIDRRALALDATPLRSFSPRSRRSARILTLRARSIAALGRE